MRKIQITLTAFALISTVIFLGLWMYEKNNQEDVVLLCHTNSH